MGPSHQIFMATMCHPFAILDIMSVLTKVSLSHIAQEHRYTRALSGCFPAADHLTDSDGFSNRSVTDYDGF